MHNYPTIAPAVSNLELNAPRGFFSVIIPEATVNLITNPSPQLALTGYSTFGGALTRSTEQQRRGVYSMKFVPAFAFDQVMFTLATTIGTIYTLSIDLFGSAGRRYNLRFAGEQKTIIATGRWQRIFVTGRALAASTNFFLESASTDPCYLDGWQVEQKAYPTTYVDGSMRGATQTTRKDIYWNGVAYASASTRTALTRNGGRVMKLDQYHFRLMAIIGLSAQLAFHAVAPLSTGGSTYQRTTFPNEQTFSLTGVIEAAANALIDQDRSNLTLALSAYATPDPQPVSLLYQPFEDLRPTGDETEIRAVWSPDGGDVNAPHQQRLNLEFSMYVPYMAKGNQGAELLEQSTIASAEQVLYRSPTGQWSRLGTSAVGTPTDTRALAIRPAGGIYAGGTGLYGGAVSFLAQWNGAAWSTIGVAPPNNFISDMAVDSQNRLYVVGSFTTIGGIAANGIARYDPATNVWSALGTGITGGAPSAIDIAPNGDVYVGGSFTTAGGVAAANIAKFVPSTAVWSALGSGTNNSVSDIIVNAEGQVFVGGIFTAAGGVANTSRIARWNPVAAGWATAGGGVGTGNNVNGFAIGPDNQLYVFGDFTVIGGVTVKGIAIFNGTSYEPLGIGIDLTSGVPVGGGFDARGILNIVGSYFRLGDSTVVPESFVRWVGGAIVPGDFDIAGGTVQTKVALASPEGGLYIGFANPPSPPQAAIASGLTIVNNQSTTLVYPTIRLQAGSTTTTNFYQLVNETTGKGLYFNYTMQPGELITMTLEPTNIEIISSFQGNIISKVAAGSQLSEMYLLPGLNTLSLFLSRTDATVTAEWPICITSIHDAVWK